MRSYACVGVCMLLTVVYACVHECMFAYGCSCVGMFVSLRFVVFIFMYTCVCARIVVYS